MPTKHKRKHDDDKSNYDLPPTTKARPLPVIAPTKDFLAPRKKQRTEGSKRSKKNVDDTPKQFARLMAWHQQGKKIGGGLDNGERPSKKQKKKQAKEEAAKAAGDMEGALDGEIAEQEAEDTGLKILPGETLREFNVRVDQSLPLSSVAKHNSSGNAQLPADLQAKEKASRKLTKHNKRLARVQAEWRKTEEKLRAKEEEVLEGNEEKLEEEKLLWDSVNLGKKTKKGAKQVDDDPWKELEKKRAESKQKNVRDVVDAPPVLTGVKNIFKEKAERTTPVVLSKTDSGRPAHFKPRRKDELEEVRRNVIEAARRKNMGVSGRVAGIAV